MLSLPKKDNYSHRVDATIKDRPWWGGELDHHRPLGRGEVTWWKKPKSIIFFFGEIMWRGGERISSRASGRRRPLWYTIPGEKGRTVNVLTTDAHSVASGRGVLEESAFRNTLITNVGFRKESITVRGWGEGLRKGGEYYSLLSRIDRKLAREDLSRKCPPMEGGTDRKGEKQSESIYLGKAASRRRNKRVQEEAQFNAKGEVCEG